MGSGRYLSYPSLEHPDIRMRRRKVLTMTKSFSTRVHPPALLQGAWKA